MNRKPLPRWVGLAMFYGSFIVGFGLVVIAHR